MVVRPQGPVVMECGGPLWLEAVGEQTSSTTTRHQLAVGVSWDESDSSLLGSGVSSSPSIRRRSLSNSALRDSTGWPLHQPGHHCRLTLHPGTNSKYCFWKMSKFAAVPCAWLAWIISFVGPTGPPCIVLHYCVGPGETAFMADITRALSENVIHLGRARMGNRK